jgi:hypothetical protein
MSRELKDEKLKQEAHERLLGTQGQSPALQIAAVASYLRAVAPAVSTVIPSASA